MDRYNRSLLTDYIKDRDSIIKVEFYRTGQIKDKGRDINRDRYIEYPQIRKRFLLIKACQINNNDKNIKNNNSNNRTDGGSYGNK